MHLLDAARARAAWREPIVRHDAALRRCARTAAPTGCRQPVRMCGSKTITALAPALVPRSARLAHWPRGALDDRAARRRARRGGRADLRRRAARKGRRPVPRHRRQRLRSAEAASSAPASRAGASGRGASRCTPWLNATRMRATTVIVGIRCGRAMLGVALYAAACIDGMLGCRRSIRRALRARARARDALESADRRTHATRAVTFIVTGGASGLGAATAARAVGRRRAGRHRRPQGGRGAGARRELGAQARFVRTDVTDEASATRPCSWQRGASADCRASSTARASCTARRSLGREGPRSLAGFRRAVEINLIGTFNMIAPRRRRHGQGRAERGRRARRHRQHRVGRGVRRPDRAGGLQRVEGRRGRHDAAHRARAGALRHPRA